MLKSLSLAGDGGDADLRELAAVAAALAVLAPALELEDPDLLAAQVLDDLGRDRGALHRGTAHGDLVAVTQQQHLVELEARPGLTGVQGDVQHLVRPDLGLDAGDVHDRVHGTVDSLAAPGLRPEAFWKDARRVGFRRGAPPRPTAGGAEHEARLSITGYDSLSNFFTTGASGPKVPPPDRPGRPFTPATHTCLETQRAMTMRSMKRHPAHPAPDAMTRPKQLALLSSLLLLFLACAPRATGAGPQGAAPSAPPAAPAANATPMVPPREADPDDALCAPLLIEQDFGFGTH